MTATQHSQARSVVANEGDAARMISRLLVANRGEIARRIFTTCRALGIETVAVHSDADADAPFVAEADHAVRLPGNTPAETYLRIDLVLAAARRAGADAVHPGYGFLAENAEFATAVTDAGLAWVGPPAKAIAAMGDKLAAKTLLAEAGVPMHEWDPLDVGGPRLRGREPAVPRQQRRLPGHLEVVGGAQVRGEGTGLDVDAADGDTKGTRHGGRLLSWVVRRRSCAAGARGR